MIEWFYICGMNKLDSHQLMEVMELWEAATILVVAAVPVQISELYQVFLDQNVTEESSICKQ